MYETTCPLLVAFIALSLGCSKGVEPTGLRVRERVHEYYPLEPGSVWRYTPERVDSLYEGEYHETSCYILRKNWAGEVDYAFLLSDANALWVLGEIVDGEDSNWDLGYRLLSFPSLTYYQTPASGAPGYPDSIWSDLYYTDPQAVSHSVTAEIIDSHELVVPVDTLEDCLRIKYTYIEQGQPVNVVHVWYARNVGMIQRIDDNSFIRLANFRIGPK